MSGEEDNVDRVRRQWEETLPGLDTSSLEVTGRILHVAARVETNAQAALDQLGLGTGDFAVLVTLRRIGHSAGLSPGQITEETMVTAGATTQRLDRLEVAGLIERRPHPSDRRGQCIRLTRKGTRLAERAITAVTDAERNLLASLASSEHDALARLLRTLTVAGSDRTVPDASK